MIKFIKSYTTIDIYSSIISYKYIYNDSDRTIYNIFI